MTKLLIIKLGALGDVLRTTCILPGLRQKFPDAHITWLTMSSASPILTNNPFIDKTLCPEDFSISNATTRKYDLVVNLDDSPAACRIATSIPTILFIGAYIKSDIRCYTSDSALWFDMSLISRYGREKADQLKKENRRSYPSLLFEILDIVRGNPMLSIPNRERIFARNFVKKHFPTNSPIIGLNTGAGDRWRFKRLSEKKTAELINHLNHFLGATCALFGGEKEIHRNRSILALSKNHAINTGHDNSLLEFSALIEQCDLLVTSDSLALHIASCLAIPVVAFFGPTSATEIQFFGPGIKLIPNMDCLCCYKNDCDFSPTCMDNISVELILDAVNRLLPKEINYSST